MSFGDVRETASERIARRGWKPSGHMPSIDVLSTSAGIIGQNHVSRLGVGPGCTRDSGVCHHSSNAEMLLPTCLDRSSVVLGSQEPVSSSRSPLEKRFAS
ncbi:hypothetical protein RB949 [Rhodopirellula baltica SH 1]|uniref:Uncharacterized protein n=1 Tax=Rhodopirellula baltica (strain DSM 10527 / NCIMB 13988 / SH1) TaxID=243090 RepID=Q7UY14_RHOBA|nr:hypothetical protein RB949 [Rhodopirellula baltica SH 1]